MSNPITPGAVQLMLQQVQRDLTVQILSPRRYVKQTKKPKIECQISDGVHKISALIPEQLINQGDNNAIVTVISYGKIITTAQVVYIFVNDCFVVEKSEKQIGSPVNVLKPSKPATSTQQPTAAENPEQPASTADQVQRSGVKTGPIIATPARHPRVIRQTSVNQNEEYQKISELYPDFQNWKIIARLVKKSYKQFTAKAKNKLTKVLNLELIDRTGMRITGAMFGEQAKQVHQALKEDNLYQISKGQIRQDQYNSQKKGKYSRYTIIFNKQSQFKLCVNSDLVPKVQSNLSTLSQINQSRQLQQQYDVVAILLAIHQQVQIPRDNQTLYKQVLQICDPINELAMQAIVWKRNVTVEERWVGKTLGLFSFKLKQFNQRLSLNSNYQSEIRMLERHEYRQYEDRIDKSRLEYLSHRKGKTAQVEEDCKNLRELETSIVYLRPDQQLKSTLTLILSQISHKKWSYESCPFCRKSAEAGNRCDNCSKRIDETVPRYKLNVELSDYCGSVWATGFEEVGVKLFEDVPQGIKAIKNMTDVERHRLFEKKQFQQFTVKLTTKMDREGQIKHTVNKIFQCNIGHKIKQTLQKINNLK